MPNGDTKVQLTPDEYPHPTSLLAAKHSSRLNSFVPLGLRRNSLRNSSACMRSLHDPARTQSPYDFPIVCMLFTQYFMSQCWNQHH